ncbi:MAG: ferrous iron transport protein A [Firmicutes bacterium]|nr:ferrous iron transport protein A [Bacillota bacterium]
MRRRHRGGRRGHQHGHGKARDLYGACVGKQYTVEEVPATALLSCLGICPKSVVRKKYCYRMGGPVLLQVGSREVAVGKDIASQIIVREV